MGPVELRGHVQRYSWGKQGAASRISGFLERFESCEPLAEYWLGTHPKGPSDVLLPSGEIAPLGSFLDGSTELSFMLKVLSINPEFGLSIQSHPDSLWAKTLHQRDPSNYPDASHKPEIGVALTPVTLLYGFRPMSQFVEIVRQLPAFERVWGGELIARLQRVQSQTHQPELLKDMFSRTLNFPGDEAASVVREICGLRVDGSGLEEELSVVNRLRQCYGDGDTGLLAIFMMNIVHLQAGEAVFIGPNCPHAYLDGDLVECMASSDNVIRAGLTPKFKDIDTLLRSVSYANAGLPVLAKASAVNSELAVFDLPIDDFTLALTPQGTGSVFIPKVARDAIMLCIGEQAKVSGAHRAVALKDGGAVFLPAQSGPYTIERRNAAIFLASRA